MATGPTLRNDAFPAVRAHHDAACFAFGVLIGIGVSLMLPAISA
jgi:hypothetical protein